MAIRSFLSVLLFICFFSMKTHAQNIRISGRIVDDAGLTLPNCNVMLYDRQDSILVTGLISDTDGLFTVHANTGSSYLLEISMLGFDKKVFPLDIKDRDIQLGDILLRESSVNLSEITVTATKNEIEFSLGKIIVNLSSPLIKASSNILDVLKTMPGVFVREDGAVSLNGQIGSQIIVNGKPTYLSGENLINLLRSMPAASVSKIELITHPSAQYDAAGNGGIINLHMDRHFFRGTSLSAHTRYTQGNPDLKPSLSDNVELSFVWKNRLKASVFVLHVSDPMSKSFHLEENNLILVYPDNLSSGYSYGMRLNSTVFNPAAWWKVSANLTLNYKRYKWFFFDKEEKESVFSPYAGLNNQFEFAKNWAAEVYLSYQGKNADGQYSFEPMFIGNVGIRRQILKGNGSLSFTIDDMFESNLLKGKVRMPGRLYISRERELGRLFRISFLYRFRQGKGAREAERKRGVDERDRI